MNSGLDNIRSITDFELKDKRVFLRLDLNVPMKGSEISDDTRIQAALPTIRYALENHAKLVIASHLGRPKGPEDREKNSLEAVAKRLAELLKVEVHLVEDPSSKDGPKGLLSVLRENQIILLENLRFDQGEEKNSDELASHWSNYTDIYINDAFGASHRAHASIVALPKQVKNAGIGFLIKKEIEMLDKILYKVDRPFVAILGGSKVSDKIGVIDHLMDQIDVFLIGGAMAYTFLASQKINVGKSKIETDRLKLATDLLDRIQTRGKKILLPVDHVISTAFEGGDVQNTSTPIIPEGWMGLDIGPQTRELYRQEILKAKTVFWNGPMGVFEKPEFSKGTFFIAEALTHVKGTTIVGGGDSAAAVNASGTGERMTHISTGGGASLEYLQGDKLPGLEILRK